MYFSLCRLFILFRIKIVQGDVTCVELVIIMRITCYLLCFFPPVTYVFIEVQIELYK